MLHNRYRAPGGEERAVANLVEMLSRHGHAVRLLERSSADLGRLGAAGGDDRRRPAARRGRPRRHRVRRRRRARPQRPSAVRLARAAGRRRGRCRGRAAPAQLPPVLRGRNRVSRRDAVLFLRCAQHAPGPGPPLPRIGLPRRPPTPPDSACSSRDCWRTPTASSRSAGFTAGKLIEHGLPADRTDVLPNFTPTRIGREALAAPIRRVRAGERTARAREGIRHGDRRGARRRDAARDRRRRSRCGAAGGARRRRGRAARRARRLRTGWRSCAAAPRSVWCRRAATRPARMRRSRRWPTASP